MIAENIITENKTEFEEELLQLMLRHKKISRRIIIKILIDDGSINKDSAKNFLIPIWYRELQVKENMAPKEAREQLAQDFNTGIKNIERILYPPRKVKKFNRKN